jgi:DNA-binding transcriptional regulator LsrR (DeoR family)
MYNRSNKGGANYELTEKVRLVADLYYTYNMHQHEIAEKLDISRPWVSRLLKRAEELGIVRIEIDTYTTAWVMWKSNLWTNTA